MKNFFIYIFLFLFIVSCQSTKDALTLKKSNADEFLVEKSPLVLPPEYGKLPTPNSGLINKNILEDKDDNIVIDEESLTSKKTQVKITHQSKKQY